jgi:hypothetical protein
VNPAVYVDKKTALLSESEVELINRLIALGYQYKLVKEFNDKYSGIGPQDGGLATHLAYG